MFLWLLLFPLLLCGEISFLWDGAFAGIADHVITRGVKIDPHDVRKGDLIYVDTNFMDYFAKKVFPELRWPYILLTHEADFAMPGKYRYILKDRKLVAWFALNLEGKPHSKLHHVPLGAKCMASNSEIANRVIANQAQYEKSHLLYVNFRIENYPQERQFVFDLFSAKTFSFTCLNRGYEDYLEDLVSSKFVLSPRGNGQDCFRTWEAIHVGTIPIVRSSSLDPLYQGLPVLIVKEWEEITEEFLNTKYEEMSRKSYNLDKLTLGYWAQQIKAYQRKARLKKFR